MNRSDNINKYIVLALILHSLFLVTFSINKSVNDITTIGETGMAIQMMILETSDEVYEKSFASEEIRNKTNDSEEEQQVLPTILIMEESVRSLTRIKDIHYLPDRGRLKVRLKYNLQY